MSTSDRVSSTVVQTVGSFVVYQMRSRETQGIFCVYIMFLFIKLFICTCFVYAICA